MMKELKIRDLLFGENSEVPLKTINSLCERGLVPSIVNKASARRWKSTFVGNFLCHYTDSHGVVYMVCQLFQGHPSLEDFTEEKLEEIVEKLKEKSPGTAKQYASMIKSTITRLLESDSCHETIGCKRYAKILSLDSCPTTKPYMGLDDLKAFMSYEPQTLTEKNIKAVFAVMLMTGARYSDVVNFKRANIQDGVLTYVPNKTKFHGTIVSIPVSEAVIEYIEHIENNKCDYHLSWFNEKLKLICEKCGLTEEVTYFYAGKYVTKPKYEAMRSHLGRTSFVTNMLKLGQEIHEVSKLAGHTDIAMTSRYNASTDVKLTEKANDFINMKF